MSTRMACPAAAKWRSNSRLPLSAHCRSSSTRTTGWECDNVANNPHHGGEEEEALGVSVRGLRRRKSRNSARKRGNQPGQFSSVLIHILEKLLLVSVRDEMGERFGEELIRRCEILFAMPEQHAGPFGERSPGRLGHQRGLAQARLARYKQSLASFAVSDAFQGSSDRRDLGSPPHDTGRRAHAQATRQRHPGGGDPAQGLPVHLGRGPGRW